jgi:hypothetical protein
MLTAHDIIRMAFANEYESIENDPDAKRFSLEVLNVLLADAYDAEQYYREVHRMALLEAVPTVTDMTDVVPYNDVLLKSAFPFGIEWKYCEQNLEMDKAAEYRALYENAKELHGGRYFRKKL